MFNGHVSRGDHCGRFGGGSTTTHDKTTGGCGCGSGRAKPSAPAQTKNAELNATGVQVITSVDSYGLTPSDITVAKGKPVEWRITGAPTGCMRAFVNRSLGINLQQKYPDPTVIRFTPTTAGDYDIT